MKNISSQFREELNNGNRQYVRSAEITLKDGTTLEINNSNLWQNGMILEDSVSNSNSFDISSVIIGQLTLSLNNIDDEYSDYDFTDCTADNVKVGLALSDGTVESLAYGKFYLNDASYNGSIITLTFYDALYKFDKSYAESTLEYPATLEYIVQDACDVCGVTLGTYGFDHDDYLITERPVSDGLTFRQILLWVGQISCNYFTADPQGRLKIIWYDTKSLEALITDVESSNLLDSGGNDILDSDGNPISTDKEVTANEDNIVGGNYHIINHFSNLSVGLDDVVITGIKVLYEEAGENGTEITTYQSGTDGYVLEVSGNKLIQSSDAAQQIVQDLGAKIIGLRFRTFTASTLSDPTYEAGDVALLIDRKGKRYKTLITNNSFRPGSFQSISCGATAPARQSASRYSQITQVYVDYRKDLQKEKTEREQAIEELQNRVNNSSGLFTTIEQQPDGSNIYYLHNKPQLSDSDIIWTMTAEAWTVSTNGGETPNAGMTVDGDTIVRILTAVGVNADWIKTGAFVVEKDGQIMFRADTDTGQVDIVANSFSLQGQSISDIAEQQVNDFVDAVYTPAIDNLQAQIDGQIETWFYDYIPTTTNYPASNWTTDTERDKHLGDLFYVVDNAEYGGQAYRWAKINNAYTWDYVEDTAVTKALADAAAAQDTADQKRRVFVSQPVPPYDVGDLWVGNSSSDLMRCQTSRQSGNYNAADWIKAVKYTDDSELQAFIQGDYADTIEEIKTQADQKAETWYQSTDPSINWSEDEKSEHKGDLWYNTSEEKTYIYNGTSWQETRSNPPDEVFDTINGKAQIFIAQPVTPYDVGDAWFTGTSIMVCNTARTSGNFNSADWQKKDNYTDDSALYEFIEGDYQSTIENLQEQADQKAETWYQATDPSASWSTADKAKHKGDLWYNTTEQKTYIYNGSAWEETKSNPPDEVFDTIDGKAQIYVNTPVPPYNVGDLWFNSSTSDIMTCINARETGNYTASDWQKRNKYTDDSALNNFIENEFSETIDEISNQIDGKAETWYQSTDPSTSWTTTALKNEHVGDIWYNTTSSVQKSYRWDGTSWQEMKTTPPDEVFDQIDGKAQIFISQPKPPYSAGDLWFNSSTSDIMTCVTSRTSGSYTASDWQKRNKYTDDSYAEQVQENLSSFSELVTGEMNNMQVQIDGKIETYYYDYQPTLTNMPASEWTTNEEKTKHVGDLFYWKSKGFTYRFTPDGNTFKWQAIQDSNITEALQQAANAQDTADSKRRVFYTTPSPPYDVGDLWTQGSGGDIMRCKTARQSGAYVSTDWELASKYTDDTAVDNLDDSLDQEGVFNRLTNNGATQGIYLENGQLYINASYIQSGIIAADRIDVTGIFAQDITATGTITGANLVGATGTFSGTINASGGTFSGNIDCTGTITGANLVGASGTFSGDISGSTFTGGQIKSTNYVQGSLGTLINLNDGSISTYYTYSSPVITNGVNSAFLSNGQLRLVAPDASVYPMTNSATSEVVINGYEISFSHTSGNQIMNISASGITTSGWVDASQIIGDSFLCDGWMTVNGQSQLNGGAFAPYMELSAPTPYIDFHYNKTTTDYTARIIANTSNGLSIMAAGGLSVQTGLNVYGAFKQRYNEMFQTMGDYTWHWGPGCGTGNYAVWGLRCQNNGTLYQFDSSGNITLSKSIISGLNTGSWLAGNNGTAIINSTSSGSNFNVLARMLAPTGRFIMGQYDGDFFLAYTRNSTIQAGANYVDALAKLLNNNGNTTFPGTVTAVNFSNSSLEELKTNIVPFDSALEDILNTDVYSYSLKRDIDNGFYNTKYGFIIGTGYRLSEKILSEEKDGIELYSAIALLWKGVQELYELVSGMGIIDSRIDYLQSQLDQAFERIEQLKKASI